jgi:hypothetical protein
MITDSDFRTNRPIFTGLHPACYGLPFALYAALLLTSWLAFGMDAEVRLSLAICAVYAVMYFGGIWLLGTMRSGNPGDVAESAPLGDWLNGYLSTFTGYRESKSALLEIALVPAALAAGFAGIAIAAVLARSAAIG